MSTAPQNEKAVATRDLTGKRALVTGGTRGIGAYRGWRRRSSPRARGNWRVPKPICTATTSSPTRSSAPARAVARARRDAVTATSASRRNARPTVVGTSPVGVRANSFTPSSRSRPRICWDTEGWATCSRSAAAVTEPSSATARAYSYWRRLIGSGIPFPRCGALTVIVGAGSRGRGPCTRA